jgi:hypothetical protein
MPSPPSSRQLTYLKALANRTGQTFAYPTTSFGASAEIQRLKRATPSSRTEIRVERKQISDQIANGPITNGAAVRDDELTGHGSTATWAHNRHPQSHPTPTAPAPPQPRVSARTELARYTLPEGERVLYGQRIDGVVRVIDRPAASATPSSRAYLVERGLGRRNELDALITDYLAEANRLQEVPMSVTSLDRDPQAMS